MYTEIYSTHRDDQLTRIFSIAQINVQQREARGVVGADMYLSSVLAKQKGESLRSSVSSASLSSFTRNHFFLARTRKREAQRLTRLYRLTMAVPGNNYASQKQPQLHISTLTLLSDL